MFITELYQGLYLVVVIGKHHCLGHCLAATVVIAVRKAVPGVGEYRFLSKNGVQLSNHLWGELFHVYSTGIRKSLLRV